MFDFEDFVLCVECLLLGTEEAEKLWTATAHSSTTRTWRSTLPAATGDSSPDLAKMEEKGKSSTRCTAEFIDVIFRHTMNADNRPPVSCPTLQIGVLFTPGTTDTTLADDSSSSFCYTLSTPLSKQDIAAHYHGIGAELDDYSADEILNLAKMFVSALRGFRKQDMEARDKVVLMYKEFDTSLPLMLPTPIHHKLSTEFITVALLGVVQPPSHSVNATDVLDADINVVRAAVQTHQNECKTKANPVVSAAVAPSSMTQTTTSNSSSPKAATVKAKPAARKPYKKQKVVLQNRRKANKLLPTT